MTPFAAFAALQGVSGLASLASNAVSRTLGTSGADKDKGSPFADMLAPLQNLPMSGQNQPGMSTEDRSKLFDQIDADGNGTITRDEMKTFRDKKMREAQSALLDLQEAMQGKSNSTSNTRKKHRTPLDELMQAIHGNNDAASSQQPVRHHHHRRHGGSQLLDNVMSALDADRSGGISRDEFLKATTTPAQSAAAVTAAPTVSG